MSPRCFLMVRLGLWVFQKNIKEREPLLVITSWHCVTYITGGRPIFIYHSIKEWTIALMLVGGEKGGRRSHLKNNIIKDPMMTSFFPYWQFRNKCQHWEVPNEVMFHMKRCSNIFMLEIFPREVILNMAKVLFRKMSLMLFMIIKYFKNSINA